MLVRNLLVSAAAVLAFANPASAAPSVEEQKAQAELDQLRAQIDSDRLKDQMALLSAIRESKAGEAASEKIETSAEALILTRRLYSEAATRLAADTGFTAGSRPIIVIGSKAPSVAEWIAFKAGSERLHDNVKSAAARWEAATAKPGAKSLELEHTFPMIGMNLMSSPLTTFALGLDVITSVAGLFKFDHAVTAAALAFDGTAMDAALSEALARKGFAMAAASDFEIPPEPSRAKDILQSMAPDLRKAQTAYGEYLQRLKAVDKAEELGAAISGAGEDLKTVLADYDALLKALYTPVEGSLPATMLDRQADLLDNRGRPIVYVRGHNAALTTTTSKSFITSLSSRVPVFLSAAASVDYVLLQDGKLVPGNVVCAVPRTRLPDAPAAKIACRQTVGRPAVITAAHASSRTLGR